VVGSITADVTAFANRLPHPGETVLGNDVTLVLGGKGANQAVSAARFGAPTWIVGCVGDDSFAELTTGGLRGYGVNTDLLRSVPGPTGVAHIRVDAAGQNDIVITPLANAHLDETQVDQAMAAVASKASVLLLQLEVRADITAYAAAIGHSAGLTVVLDPAPAVPVPETVWQHVDIVTPNETEAGLITGIPVTSVDTAKQAARWFLDHGVRRAIVTLGSAGAVSVTAEESYACEPFTVRALDTTAAGDAFTGTLGAALALGQDPASAIRHASAAGALAVTKRGASPSLPARDAVLALVGQPITA
jgi:ribokinase